MVDPGHGNKDCGAYGAAGLYGPAEAELNLAVSLAVRDRLEQMGIQDGDIVSMYNLEFEYQH